MYIDQLNNNKFSNYYDKIKNHFKNINKYWRKIMTLYIKWNIKQEIWVLFDKKINNINSILIPIYANYIYLIFTFIMIEINNNNRVNN